MQVRLFGLCVNFFKKVLSSDRVRDFHPDMTCDDDNEEEEDEVAFLRVCGV